MDKHTHWSFENRRGNYNRGYPTITVIADDRGSAEKRCTEIASVIGEDLDLREVRECIGSCSINPEIIENIYQTEGQKSLHRDAYGTI